MTHTTTARIGEAVAFALTRTATRPHDRAALLTEALMGFTVPALVEFLAEEGVRFTGRPKRAEVVGEFVAIFAETR